jgi:hypothetical protein
MQAHGVGPVGGVSGVSEFTSLVPAIAATGGRTMTGSCAMTIPIGTLAATGYARNVSVVGNFTSSAPVPTISATGVMVTYGSPEWSILIPTIATTGNVLFTANAETQYTADGATETFLIGFGYLSVDHLTVKVAGVEFEIGSADLSISDDGTEITFTTAPASSALVQIIRNTPHPTLEVEFSTRATITPEALNRAILQCLYYAEEVDDLI